MSIATSLPPENTGTRRAAREPATRSESCNTRS